MSVSAALGIFGCGLLSLAAAAAGLRVQRLSLRARIAAMLAAGLAVFVPVGELSVAGYVRGVTGDVSMTTLVLAGAACMAQLTGRAPIGPRDRRALLWLVAAGAVFLYPFALGLTPFDPYALGFGSVGFVTTLLLVTLAAWYARFNLIVLIVIVAALAYLGGGYESRNLWDYLIDPLVSVYVLGRLLAGASRRRLGDIKLAFGRSAGR
ncbi:MAG TPA: hypothetical protein VK138_15700 [Acidiferrobacterales bacterium]|nr:hypothetical protein [Acidiferrobacterales bacterium]